jgi:hypothetical protein
MWSEIKEEVFYYFEVVCLPCGAAAAAQKTAKAEEGKRER